MPIPILKSFIPGKKSNICHSVCGYACISQGINGDLLRVKFRIERTYFICSNQFWKHKNHLIVLKAILELKEKGRETCVVFTGMPNDPRNPEYYQSIQDFVKENSLEMNTRFVGFIDRKEQLVLMKNSEAIIQPSLFEGWSTVVEDAKALQHPIFTSDIPVHREQLGPDFDYYFHPDDHLKLAELMVNMTRYNKQDYGDYEQNIKLFGNKMIDSMSGISVTNRFK